VNAPLRAQQAQQPDAAVSQAAEQIRATRDADFERLLSLRPVDLGPRDFNEALTQAEYLAASEMVPKAYRGKPGDCLIAIQWGGEIGLKPLQAMQSIAAVNGKPSLYGDAGKAMLLAHGCIIEEDDTELVKANGRARCVIRRRGRPPVQRTFSIEDAKTAGLWGKEGPWRAYPYRQMAWRAFWFAARDAAADVLRGMGGYEEALDGAGEWEASAPPPPPNAPALPPYADEAFAKNLPLWAKLVADGKKAPGDLLATLATKATFSEEQKARILSLKKAQPEAAAAAPAPAPAASGEHDDFIGEMDAAEEAAK
jgi:hypothetical protein